MRVKTKRSLAILMTLTMLMCVVLAAIPASAASYELEVTSLETNSIENPSTVDDTTPNFSWKMSSNLVGQEQTAYQVVVTNESTGDVVWDSGKVEGNQSMWINYPETATALTAKTTYNWTVTVWDSQGLSVISEPATFTTGLISEELSAWSGAQWIGSDELYLDAASIPIYIMNYTMQLDSGSESAGFVFGANDARLNDPIYNNYLISGENYIMYELDLSGTTYDAAINVYRKGYAEGEETPILVSTIDVSSVITSANCYDTHDYVIAISGNQMASMTIDGVSVATYLILNPLNETGDVPIYPRLNNIGFATGTSSSAVFSDVSVQNYRSPNAELFGENTGATYYIFNGLAGITVDGSNIEVSADTLTYADPSYGSIPMLRKDITTQDKEIESATLYAISRGVYEIYINGDRVGDDYFTPGNTDYRQQIQYTSYDVTDMVSTGKNAIGAILGSGWYGDQSSFTVTNYNFYGDSQALLAMLDITYTDGTTDTITTDDSWEYYGDGPIRYAGFFNGETYDATLEDAVEGWSTSSYDSSEWKAATVVSSTIIDTGDGTTEYSPRIVAKTDEAVQVVETLDSTYVGSQTRDGQTVYIYNMGTNMVGVPKITLPEGTEGQEVVIRFAESIYPDLDETNENNYGDLTGLILTENYRGALSTDKYIMRGTVGGETYTPSFTFHGYQYIEISGIDSALPAESVKGIVLSSLTEATSTYESSNGLTNQLFENIMRSTYGNHLSIATDCPQRDERLGWSGDAQVFSRTATYMSDMNAFYRNFTSIIRDAQNKTNGVYASYSPSFAAVDGGSTIGYCWSAVGVVVPYETYLQYGDISIIEEHYESMQLHMTYLMGSHASGKEYLTSATGFLADHLSIASTNTALLANATFYYVTCAMVNIAELMSDTAQSEAYAAFAEGLKAEWNETYVDADTHKTMVDGVIQDTQASYSLPLEYDIFNDENKPYAQQYLVDACASEGYTMTTGFVGTAPLLPSLTQAGNIDDAYKMFEQTAYASWLYPVVNGATSIWERWNSFTTENGYGGNNSMNSFNHYSLGAVGAWMMGYQVGIQRDDASGFQSFTLQPTPGGTLTYVNGSYDSDYGTIVSNWSIGENEELYYHAEVPANTTATLYLPAETAGDVANVDGATFVEMTENNGQSVAKFDLTAGGYDFVVTENGITVSVSEGYVVLGSSDSSIDSSVDPSVDSPTDSSIDSSLDSSYDTSSDLSASTSFDTSTSSTVKTSSKVTTTSSGSAKTGDASIIASMTSLLVATGSATYTIKRRKK